MAYILAVMESITMYLEVPFSPAAHLTLKYLPSCNVVEVQNIS